LRAIIISAAIVAIFPINVFAYCSEPSAPSCASSFGSFDDEWEFDRCKRDMEAYRSEVEDFIQCNNEEARRAQQASEEAASEYSDAVDSFNRRANN